MKTQIVIVKNFDYLSEGDVLTLNPDTLRFELKKEVDKLVGGKIKTVDYEFALTTNFVLDNLGEYLEVVDDADEVDPRDLEIKELKQQVEQLKRNKYWYKW